MYTNMTGISVTSVQQAEKGIVPGKAILYSLSEYFKVSFNYLRHGQGDHASEEMPLYHGSKSELQDGEGLYGKTHRREVEGAHLTITEFEPKDGQVKDGINKSVLVKNSQDRIPCPHCAELIMPTAKKCPFCKSDL